MDQKINIAEGDPQPGSILDQIAQAAGGKATLRTLTDKDGDVVHSFATMSLPLRDDHWIYQKDDTPAGFKTNVPPMPFRMGEKDVVLFALDEGDIGSLIKSGQRALPAHKLTRSQFAKAIRAAGKYAVRCATINGSEMDFDPDALLQNLVVGFLGYWTADGLTGDPEDAAWCDPQTPFDFTEPPPVNFPSGNVGEALGSDPDPAPATAPGVPEAEAKWCPTCTPDGSCPVHSGKTGVPAGPGQPEL
jgi:hypothetical protein